MSSTYMQTQLPWASSEKENRTFSFITYGALALTLLLGGVVNLVELPEQTREEKATLPPQLARIIQPKVPPPPPIVEPKPEPVVEETPPVEVEEKVKSLKDIKDCEVEITFDPPWTQDLMSEEAKLELGML